MFLIVLAGSTLLLSLVSSQITGGNVAFSVAFNSDQTIEANRILVYNTVLLNCGGGYNSVTGVFTAPKGGLYVFHIHALSLKEKDFWIDLYLNDRYVISAFGRQAGGFAAGGNSVVLRLSRGDRVYVRTSKNAYIYGRADEIYATFSGYLFAPM